MAPTSPVITDVGHGWCPFAKIYRLTRHYSTGSIAQKNTIVLHITEGTTFAGAFATFNTEPVSAHFIIDRDGTIYQLVSIINTAWHASQCNTHSIGIEHVALSVAGAKDLNWRYAKEIIAGKQTAWVPLPATDAQYLSSQKLISWLCDQLGILPDRNHIRTHNEASPRDGHVQCCTGALDPDKVVNWIETEVTV